MANLKIENGTITAKGYAFTPGYYSWIDGISINNGDHCISTNTNFTASSYTPILNFRTSSGYKVSFGGIADYFGFSIANADRTENGRDDYFQFEPSNKIISSTFKFNGVCATAENANTLGGYDSDSFIRRLHWQSGDGNSVDNYVWGVGFAYGAEHGTPASGPFCSFGAGNWLKNYRLQLNASYYDSNPRLYWRTYNGDKGTWNSWKGALMLGDTLNTSNYGTSTPSAAASSGDVYFKIV